MDGQVASASSATEANLANPSFKLGEISVEERDVMYVFENTIRSILPAFDAAVEIYEHQMNEFGRLTTILTSVSSALTSIVVIAIAINVLRARVNLLQVDPTCSR
jgi:hypothetical protein